MHYPGRPANPPTVDRAVHTKWESAPAHSMRRGWRASSPVLAERCVPALSWLLPGMGPPGGRWLRPNLRAPRAEVLSGGTRASEHLVLRLVRFGLPSARRAGRHHSVHRSRVACVACRVFAFLSARNYQRTTVARRSVRHVVRRRHFIMGLSWKDFLDAEMQS